jgi:hypothetical protein
MGDNKIDVKSILDFLIASAVIHIHDQHAEDAATIDESFGGFLVSEIVAGLQKPPDRGARTKSLMVFLDTPVVLPYLGFSSRSRCELVEQLLGDVRQMGISLAVFDHTVAEMHRVIKASLDASHAYEAIGDVSIRILQDPDARTRARMYVSNPRDQLKKVGINIVDFEQKFADTYKFFSREHENDLLTRIRPWREIKAREADVSSLANVYRLIRRHSPASSILSARAVFVSSNSALVHDGLRYFRETGLVSPHQAPLFLTDRQLAGLAWVAVGGRAAELPRKRLISNCMAAVAPRPDVLIRMRALLAETDPERMKDFEALVTDERCSHHLMDLTFGSPDLLTAENCLERFEQIKRKTASDVEQEKERPL